jgi:2-amino-4-hydroxy-6-hydroxymethyldihydropteridine diphosphokinase
MVLCVLGLGSNRPYKDLCSNDLIKSAAAELQKTLIDMRLSPLYKTAPLHVTDQEPFVNAAVAGFFDGEAANGARKLLEIIQSIEARFGRDRSAERRWGERSMDIDILLFGDLTLAEPDLTIPHPRLKERAFALRPLLDLLPDAREPVYSAEPWNGESSPPVTGAQYSDILAALPDQKIELL